MHMEDATDFNWSIVKAVLSLLSGEMEQRDFHWGQTDRVDRIHRVYAQMSEALEFKWKLPNWFEWKLKSALKTYQLFQQIFVLSENIEKAKETFVCYLTKPIFALYIVSSDLIFLTGVYISIVYDPYRCVYRSWLCVLCVKPWTGCSPREKCSGSITCCLNPQGRLKKTRITWEKRTWKITR